MLWIERGLGVVPTEFSLLVEELISDPELKSAVDDLVETKRSGFEGDYGPRIEPISRFVEEQLARLKATQF